MQRRAKILIGIAAAAAAATLAWLWFAPYRGFRQPQIVNLRAGTGTRAIAQQLRRAGVIRSSTAFLLWDLLHRKQTLKAGAYRFRHAHSLTEVFARLAAGRVFYYSFTVPEGYNRFEIAQALENDGLASRESFLRASADGGLARKLDPQAQSLEGYLYPATYHFAPGESAEEIAAAMVKRFKQEMQRQQWTGIPARAAAPGGTGAAPADPAAPADIHSWVTMASLIVKETQSAGERRLVAGVFYNRLRQGLPLQCDPTVIYAAQLAGEYQGAITRQDLKLDSPYNTYLRAGLPPGPIANPGQAALAAAAQPAKTDYLYFVSNGHGGHRFARTLAGQDRNIRLYLKKKPHR